MVGFRAVNAMAVDPARDRELIGSNIRLARRLAGGVSQGALADQLNQRLGTRITISDISKWENGHHSPRPGRLLVIADVLGRTRGWFHDPHPEHDDA